MAARLSIAIKAIKRSARFQTILRLATLPKYTITSTQPRKIQLAIGRRLMKSMFTSP